MIFGICTKKGYSGWKGLPNRGLGQKGKECKGEKKKVNRMTVAFFLDLFERKNICYLEVGEASISSKV